MGSFNVGCGLSNLAIRGADEVGFVLLLPGKEAIKRQLNHKTATSHYNYANHLFRPYLPPIFGRYDDYGRIVDIKESQTTKTIEEISKRPLEEVLKEIHSGRGKIEEIGENLFDLSGMFFLKEVYDEMSSFNRAHELKHKGHFAQLGITNWDEVRKEGIQAFLNEVSTELMVDSDFTFKHAQSVEDFRQFSSVQYKDYPALSNYARNDEFMSLIMLDDLMNKVNRMFLPSFNGEEEGTSAIFNHLAGLTQQIVQNRKSEEEEDYFDADDEEGTEEDSVEEI